MMKSLDQSGGGMMQGNEEQDLDNPTTDDTSPNAVKYGPVQVRDVSSVRVTCCLLCTV